MGGGMGGGRMGCGRCYGVCNCGYGGMGMGMVGAPCVMGGGILGAEIVAMEMTAVGKHVNVFACRILYFVPSQSTPSIHPVKPPSQHTL